MAIAAGDLPEADRHLARAIEVNGSVLKGFLLRALVLNRLNRSADAAGMIRRAAALDPECAFVSCARMLVGAGDPSLAGRIRTRYADFPEEILEVTATLYSAGLRGGVESLDPFGERHRTRETLPGRSRCAHGREGGRCFQGSIRRRRFRLAA